MTTDNPYADPVTASAPPPPSAKLGRSVLALATSAVVVAGLSGLSGAWTLAEGAETFVAEYDQSWDPIVIEGGVLRIDGPRVPELGEGFAFDPNDQIDLDAVEGQLVVARSREVVQVRAFDRRSYRYVDFLEGGNFRFDGAAGRAMLDEYGHWIWLGVPAGALLFIAPTYMAVAAVVAGLASGGLSVFWRAEGRPEGRALFARALLLSAALPPIWAMASQLGMPISCCVDIFVMAPMLAVATWWMSRR